MAERVTPATTPRRGRPGYDGPTVLRRAVEVFNRQGYEATSMGDLARELGLTKSAIYHHVSGKEALLAAALDEALDGLEGAIDGVAIGAVGGAPGTSASDRSALFRETITYDFGPNAQHGIERIERFTQSIGEEPYSEIELAALQRRRVIDDKLAGLVRAAVDEGSVRADIPPELISRLVFGLVNSLVEWYRPDGPVTAADLSRSITDLAFEGLASR